MKTAVISLAGLPGIDKPENIKTVQYSEESQLIAHLIQLQRGYHEKGDGRALISKYEKEVKGQIRRVIDCHSYHTDFHHVAHIGLKIKDEVGKPYEILS